MAQLACKQATYQLTCKLVGNEKISNKTCLPERNPYLFVIMEHFDKFSVLQTSENACAVVK